MITELEPPSMPRCLARPARQLALLVGRATLPLVGGAGALDDQARASVFHIVATFGAFCFRLRCSRTITFIPRSGSTHPQAEQLAVS